MTIKETAGKVLLFFYHLQRTAPSSMQYRQVGFLDKPNGGVSITSDKKGFTNDLISLNPQPADIFNAFTFLLDKKFIKSEQRVAKGTTIFLGVEVTSKGIDVIESVEGGFDGARVFSETFNIKADNGTSVDTLVKNNLSKLLAQAA